MVRTEQQNLVLIKLINPFKAFTHADRPSHWRALNFQYTFHFVQQFDRFAAFAVQLVDKGQNRRIAQAADFHQFDGSILYTLGDVDHHQSRVHRGQSAVSIFREVFVARRVQQIDDAIVVFELHHRRGDGNAAFLFHLHPVGGGMTRGFSAFNRAGQLNRAAEQQQFFGDSGFSRVGMRDDREGSASIGFCGNFSGHDA